jgi:hypothetical protein
MPSKSATALTKKHAGQARYQGQSKVAELKMLYSKGNGYEGRYDFPVTITKIEDKDENA